MAKKSSIAKNKKRIVQVANSRKKRDELKKIVMDKTLPLEQRFEAQLKLSSLPRDGSYIRVRNRCEITGRPRGFYRKFKISRIKLRDLASIGQLPGVIKSSW